MSQLAVGLASWLMATAYPAVVPALLSTYQFCLWFIVDKTSNWVVLVSILAKEESELLYTPSTTAEVRPMIAPLTLPVKLLPLHKTKKSKGSQKQLPNIVSYLLVRTFYPSPQKVPELPNALSN
ncbi:hypothetical protein CSV68_11890 [Sporosarcina sp. P29]|nr:hypothetical protein CSV68_11890 [Sporosarcina sp. P29]